MKIVLTALESKYRPLERPSSQYQWPCASRRLYSIRQDCSYRISKTMVRTDDKNRASSCRHLQQKRFSLQKVRLPIKSRTYLQLEGKMYSCPTEDRPPLAHLCFLPTCTSIWPCSSKVQWRRIRFGENSDRLHPLVQRSRAIRFSPSSTGRSILSLKG